MKKQSVLLLRSNPVNPDPPVEKTAKALVKNGYRVTIAAWDRAARYESKTEELVWEEGKAKVIRFGIPATFGGGLKKNLKPLLRFQKQLYVWLKAHHREVDILHSFDLDTGYIAQKIAEKYHIKHIYQILDFYVDAHPSGGSFVRKWIKKAELSVIDRANATVICTEKRKEQIYPSHPRRLTVIHNTPPKTARTTSVFSLSPSDRTKIVYVGILAEGRLLPELLKTVSADKSLALHIGGFGMLEELVRTYAEQYDNIHFYGKLAYSDTLALESQCDIMTAIYDPTVPNHRYAAPNKFYEALMLGKPLLMAKNTGFDEVVQTHGLGCLIDYSEEGLCTGIKTVKQGLISGAFSHKESAALYERTYSWEIMEERLTRLYDEISTCAK